MSRTLNTKRNIITSYLNTLISFLFSFISRALIIRILGSSYLGLSSLFTSILQVLSMAELGFSAAVIYNMYAPLARGDTKTVCALLNFYRKVYAVIACVICVFGVLLAPFLHLLIKGSYPPDINLYLLYFLYLGNTVSSYIFFAYKTALLNALQRLDISKIAYTIASILQYIAQIIALLLFKSYYLFVIFLLLGTVLKNVLTAYLADRYFPQYQPIGLIPLAVRRDIISRVKGLMICSIASVTTTTLDSIALSAFIGLKSVAIYNNYLLIFTGVGTFIAMIRTAMQASVGNSVALETTEKNYADMLLWQFMFSFIATWCATCMFCLYQPFMEMWMGRDMLLQDFDIVVICAWFFTGIIQHSFFLYLAGTGSWWELRWPYTMGGVTNLVMNILLAKLWGISGVLFASLVSGIVFALVWQCNIIFRIYFRRSTWQFYRRLIFYGMVCFLSCYASYLFLNHLRFGGIIGLAIRLLVCTVVSVGLQLLIYSKFSFSAREMKRARGFVSI